MPRPYSNDLRERLIGRVSSGMSARAAGRLLGVSESTAVKWVQRWRRTGSVAPARMGGYRRPVLEAHADVVLAKVASSPDLTIEELRAELGGHGITVGYGSVWRFLARHGISLKKNRSRQRTDAAGRGAGSAAMATRPAGT